MSYAPRDSYQQPWGVAPLASQADEWERTLFIRRTYLHLLLAVIAFVLIETVAFAVIPQATMENIVVGMTGRWTWLLILGGFMVVSWIARTWANGEMSPTMQYAGLGLYVVAQAALFFPLLYIAVYYSKDEQLLRVAAFITLFLFGGLTAINFLTKHDFSFLGKYLFLAGLASIGVVVCLLFFSVSPTLWFWVSVGFIVLACGYILYDTSNVIHHYRTNQHVAASLALFASVALLFWYVLQLLMSLQRR
jgi:FtsH-binding integral membrane protein